MWGECRYAALREQDDDDDDEDEVTDHADDTEGEETDGADEDDTPEKAAKKLRRDLPRDARIVCILGGTKFNDASSEALVKAIASKVDVALGSKAAFVTGGMAGVQETFAKHCGDGSHVWNLLPLGQSSNFGSGTDINAGAESDQRKAIFGLVGDIYITVEGGPGVSQEARAAHERGAAVVPLMRTGGASSGMFDFPAGALQKPDFCTKEQWSLLASKKAPVDESAAAAVAVVEAAVNALAAKEARLLSREPLEVSSRLTSSRRQTVCFGFDSRNLVCDSRESGFGQDGVPDYYQRCHRLPVTPCWAWNEHVAEVARRFGARSPQMPVPLGCTAGPAVGLAMVAVVLQVCCFLAFMPFTMLLSTCAEDGYGQVSPWSWLFFLPLSVICCRLEVAACRFVLVPKIQVLQYFRCMFPLCCVKLPATVWLVQGLCLSCLHMFNMANIGNFTAMVYKADGCEVKEGNYRIHELWHEVMKESWLSAVAGDLHLKTIGLLFWIMTFCQAIYAMLVTIPRLSQLQTDPPYYGVCVEKGRQYTTEYATLLERRTNHGTALFILAEACGMASIVDEGLKYARVKADLQWESKETLYQKRCVDHAYAQITRAIQRTVFAGGLKNTAQLNLQVTVITIRRAVNHLEGTSLRGERMAMISLFVAFMTIVSSVVDAGKALYFAREICEKVLHLHKSDFKDKHGKEDPSYLKEVLEATGRLKRRCCILVLLTAIVCWFVLLALQKLVMSFCCPSAIGNVTGCVDLAEFENMRGTATASTTAVASRRLLAGAASQQG